MELEETSFMNGPKTQNAKGFQNPPQGKNPKGKQNKKDVILKGYRIMKRTKVRSMVLRKELRRK